MLFYITRLTWRIIFVCVQSDRQCQLKLELYIAITSQSSPVALGLHDVLLEDSYYNVWSLFKEKGYVFQSMKETTSIFIFRIAQTLYRMILIKWRKINVQNPSSTSCLSTLLEKCVGLPFPVIHLIAFGVDVSVFCPTHHHSHAVFLKAFFLIWYLFQSASAAAISKSWVPSWSSSSWWSTTCWNSLI